MKGPAGTYKVGEALLPCRNANVHAFLSVMVFCYPWIYLKAVGKGLDSRVQAFLWRAYFSLCPNFIPFPVERRCCLWHPSGCERPESKSCWGEWGRNILAHLSSPLKLQNSGLVNLAVLFLKEREIALAVNIYKAGYLQRKLNFHLFLEKKSQSWLHGTCIPSWHRVAGAEQWCHALSGALALWVVSVPPLCLVLNPVSFMLTHHPPGFWRHLNIW